MKHRKQLLATLTAITLLSTALFSASDIPDPELENAIDITAKIFTANEEVKDRRYTLFADYVKGLDGEDDYIIVFGKSCGYAIYERETMELIEYSELSYTPYGKDYNIDTAYYAGPTSYYREKDGKLKHVHKNEKIEKEAAKEIAKAFKEQLKENRKKRKEKKEKEEKDKYKDQNNENGREETITPEANQDETASAVGGVSVFGAQTAEVETLYSDPGPTGEDPINLEVDSDDYTILSRKYINDKDYFLMPLEYGVNQGATCGSVAAQILLSYNNWANDGRIIPENPGGNLQFFLEPRTDELRKTPYDINMRCTSSLYKKGDGITTFYEKLIEYIDPEENGVIMSDVYNGIDQYLLDYASIAKEEISMTLGPEWLAVFNDYKSEIKDEINNNRPVIVGIITYEYDSSRETYTTGGHVIVAYGYQKIEFNNDVLDGLIVNYGWNNSPYGSDHAWINGDWVDSYISFETSHTHLNTSFQGDPHILQCSTCKRVKTTNEHTLIKEISPKFGDDYLYYHQGTCTCGYLGKEPHDYEYLMGSTTEETHTMQCTMDGCKVQKIEEHFFKVGGIRCFYCGYERK